MPPSRVTSTSAETASATEHTRILRIKIYKKICNGMSATGYGRLALKTMQLMLWVIDQMDGNDQRALEFGMAVTDLMIVMI